MDRQRKPDGVVMFLSTAGVLAARYGYFRAIDWLQMVSPFGASTLYTVDSGLVITGSSGDLATSEFADEWTLQTSSFGATPIFALDTSTSTYVAGGSLGKIATSTNDGVYWIQRSSAFGVETILGLGYHAAAGLYVAVGSLGLMSTSPDGITWTARTSSFGTTFIYDVESNGTILVAVGDAGKLATSTDGLSWTQRTSSFGTTRINAVTWGNGIFVAVGESGKLATSVDGITWTQDTSSFGVNEIRAVDYGEYRGRGTYVAAGEYGLLAANDQGVLEHYETETLLETAALWLDAEYATSSQTVPNLGSGGSALDGRLGSTGTADTNDPTFLEYDGTPYVYLPGIAGNSLSTPDAAALDITGDIDIRVKVALDDWTPSANSRLVTKYGSAGTRSYLFDINTTGNLRFTWTADGTTGVTSTATAATGITDGAVKWVRATMDADNGAVGHDVKFWLSDDGTTWTQVGSTVTTAGVASIYTASSPVVVGGDASTSSPAAGKFYRAIIKSGIDGTTVLDVDTSVITSGAATSFTATTGQTVTISRSTSGRKAVAVVGNCWLLGTDDYLEVADNALLDFAASDSFTVLIVERDWGLGAALAHVAKVSSTTAATQGWTMRASGANGALITTQMGDGTNGINSITTPARVAGALTSLAMVRNVTADTVTGYMNGTAGTPGTDTTTGSLANSNTLRIGRLSGAGANYNDFEFTAVAVFRSALTSDEIAQITRYYQNRTPSGDILGWEQRSSSFDATEIIRGVHVGSGIALAVGDSGKIAKSER